MVTFLLALVLADLAPPGPAPCDGKVAGAPCAARIKYAPFMPLEQRGPDTRPGRCENVTSARFEYRVVRCVPLGPDGGLELERDELVITPEVEAKIRARDAAVAAEEARRAEERRRAQVERNRAEEAKAEALTAEQQRERDREQTERLWNWAALGAFLVVGLGVIVYAQRRWG